MKKKKAIELYSEISRSLYDEKFIGQEDFLNVPNIVTLEEMHVSLLSLGISHNIINKKISEKLGIKSFSINDDIDFDAIILSKIGIIYGDVFYIINVFGKPSQSFKNKNKEMFNNYFFNEIGVMSLEDYCEILKEKNKANTEDDLDIAKIKTMEIVFNAIKNGVNEIIINKQLDKIIFNIEENTYSSEYETSLDVEDLDEIVIFNNVHYYLKTEEINPMLKVVLINKYSKRMNLENDDKKYGELVINKLLNSKGLFVLSSKKESNYYHTFLEKARDIHIGKKIISYERRHAQVKGVLQIDDSEELDDDMIFQSDIIFIEKLDNEIKSNIVAKSLNMGKFVFVGITAYDSIMALNNILSVNKKWLDKNLISDNLLCVYHMSKLPKLCSYCSSEIQLKNHPLRHDEKFKFLFETKDNNLFVRQPSTKGCKKCVFGYKDGVLITEFLDHEKELAMEIESGFNMRIVRNMKDSKRWETLMTNSDIQLIKGYVSLEDIKKKL